MEEQQKEDVVLMKRRTTTPKRRVIETDTTSRHLTPLFRYSGGKRMEIKRFIHHFPESFKTYVEPFVGGGAVFFYLNHPGMNVIADTDPRLTTFFQHMQKGNGPAIADKVDTMPNTKEDFMHVRDEMQAVTPIEEAAKFYFLRQTCFRGIDQWNKAGVWHVPWNTSVTTKVAGTVRLKDPAYEELFSHTLIFNQTFQDTIREYDTPDTFFFLDPPYDGKDYYGRRNFGDAEHRALHASLQNTRGKWLMVVNDTPLMRELYGPNIKDSYTVSYHMKRIKKAAPADHLVLTNY